MSSITIACYFLDLPDDACDDVIVKSDNVGSVVVLASADAYSTSSAENFWGRVLVALKWSIRDIGDR